MLLQTGGKFLQNFSIVTLGRTQVKWCKSLIKYSTNKISQNIIIQMYLKLFMWLKMIPHNRKKFQVTVNLMKNNFDIKIKLE